VRDKEKNFVVARKIKRNGSSESSDASRLKRENRLNIDSKSLREIALPYPFLVTIENNKPTNKLYDGSEGNGDLPNQSDLETNHAISKEVLEKSGKEKTMGLIKNMGRKEFITPYVSSTHQGIYFGLSFGPSLSRIKSGGLGRIGYDIGILAGYRLKYYFSDGKYFSMDKVRSSMPSGMEVLDLHGSTTIFEIPLRIKYDVIPVGRARLFLMAGISSGIMTNEKNNYRTSMNGSEQNLAGAYNHVSGYFANSLDLSFGYENKIGKIGNFRIEPYMKIPLKGTGVGALPVVSTGLHIAFTRFSH
jgi:hypothetical protein